MKIFLVQIIISLFIISATCRILQTKQPHHSPSSQATSPRKLSSLRQRFGIGLPIGITAGAAGLWYSMPSSSIKNAKNLYKSTLDRYRFRMRNTVMEERELYDDIEKLLDDGGKQLQYLETVAMHKARAMRTNVDVKLKMFGDVVSKK